MYDYVALRVDANPCNETITDLIAAFLAELEFESFEPDEKGLTAYIRKDKYDSESTRDALADFPMETSLSFSESEIEGEDWNKEWEQNYFQPIAIEDKVVIRSSFHSEYPRLPLEIIIDPKMAFGTGHHATTAGMSKMLLEEDLRGKSVIDMGTGTGILAILARKLGAGDIFGIDIDEFAIENAKENAILNNVEGEWIVGDDKALKELKPADFFLANINLNIISANLENYLGYLKPGGEIFLSGFLVSDKDIIMQAANRLGLTLLKESSENNWLTLVFKK